MYIDVNNIARDIREAIMDEFALDIDTNPECRGVSFKGENQGMDFKSESDSIISLEEGCETKAYFRYLKRKNYQLYKQIIGIIFVDYYLVLLSYNLTELDETNQAVDLVQFHHFECNGDVADFIEENPDYFMPMMAGSLEFHLAEPEDKRAMLNRSRGLERYLLAINPFHILDRVEYCRFLTKEDIFIKQRDFLNDYENQTDYDDKSSQQIAEEKIINNEIAIYDASSYLRHINSFSEENYRALILDIIEDYYKYQKYLQLNGLTPNKEIMTLIENNSLRMIIKQTLQKETILPDILLSFVEYHQQSEDIKTQVNEKLRLNRSLDIKKLLLSNDNY